MDIVERLRREYQAIGAALHTDAADEIERLRKEWDYWREAARVNGNAFHAAKEQLATVAAERNELVEAVKAALSDDQPYISKCKDALAKVGADKGEK